MLHGKHGFDRIVWAFKNVLNHCITWLFYDLQSEPETETQKQAPLDMHHPFNYQISPTVEKLDGVKVPALRNSLIGNDDSEYALELHEWLGLIKLSSPRVRICDKIDPYLCRYQAPEAESAETYDLVYVKWKGFIPNVWTRSLFTQLR